MRPRVFPAEDARRRYTHASVRSASFNEAAGIPRGRHRLRGRCPHRDAASMRPRVFPAEDSPRRPRRNSERHSSFNEAAGIPRGRRGWNDARNSYVDNASMRPRVFPAEDSVVHGPSESTTARFNEAAGIPRGRLRGVPPLVHDIRASMRPRVFPAEDGPGQELAPVQDLVLQ